MATLLKYNNGLLIPVQHENTSDLNTAELRDENATTHRNRLNLSFRKIYNLLIMLTVIINTILTVAAVSHQS